MQSYPEPIDPAEPVDIDGESALELTTAVRHFFDVIVAHWILVLAALAISVTLFAIEASRTTPVYLATTTIQIEPSLSPLSLRAFRRQKEVFLAEKEAFRVELDNLESRELAGKVIAALQLDKKPLMEHSDSVFRFLFRDPRLTLWAIVDYILTLRESRPAQKDNRAGADPLQPYIRSYLAGLRVKPVPETNLVTVSYESPDPGMAAIVVNKHVEQFVAQRRGAAFKDAEEASESLEKQVEVMQAELIKAETALQEFGKTHQVFFQKEDVNTDMSRLAQLEELYANAQIESLNKESGVRAALAPSSSGSDSDRRLVDLRLADARLAATYREDYESRKIIRSQITEIERTIEKERVRDVMAAQKEYAAAVNRRDLFFQEFQSQKNRVDRMNQDVVQYSILKQHVDSARTLHTRMVRRLGEIDVASDFSPTVISVIDRAETPTTPVGVSKGLVFLESVAMGLAIGIGLAFLKERADSSFKSPGDVTKHLGLPVLAVVPTLGSVFGTNRRSPAYGDGGGVIDSSSGRQQSVELIVQNSPESLLSEGYRSLRASLLLSTPDHPPRTILVSSSVPSEGKTSTVANLGIGLAQTGAKVVLIDGDMRKPRLDTVFSLLPNAGLSNFLSGAALVKDVIHVTAIPNLFVIPCGAIPPNPGELILSSRFKELMALLPAYFDYVVLDSPPLASSSDGRVLAATVDAMILVVKARATLRHVVRNSLKNLEESQSRLVGVVLNDYDVRRQSYRDADESAPYCTPYSDRTVG